MSQQNNNKLQIQNDMVKLFIPQSTLWWENLKRPGENPRPSEGCPLRFQQPQFGLSDIGKIWPNNKKENLAHLIYDLKYYFSRKNNIPITMILEGLQYTRIQTLLCHIPICPCVCWLCRRCLPDGSESHSRPGLSSHNAESPEMVSHT